MNKKLIFNNQFYRYLSAKPIENNFHKFNDITNGRIIANYGNEYIIQNDNNLTLKCTIKRSITKSDKKKKHFDINPTIGDFVKVEYYKNSTNQLGRINYIYKRYNYIEKYNPRIPSRPKILAANIDHMCIITSYFPQLEPFLIDRYLCTAESMNINASIIHNKLDLKKKLNPQHIDQDNYILDTYKDLGYPIFPVSMLHNLEMEKLKEHMTLIKRKSLLDICPLDITPNILLLGQSGVGKSASINRLLNLSDSNEELLTQEINKHGRGIHTTTNSISYRCIIPCTSKKNQDNIVVNLIDTPGINNFYMPSNIEYNRLQSLYPEFSKYVSHCKYKNCQHIDEDMKICAVKRAAADYMIDPRRYESYVKEYNELKLRKKTLNK